MSISRNEKQIIEREHQRQFSIEKNKLDSQSVINDLEKIGIHVELISDLYNKSVNYKNAIPILLKWLPLIDNLDVKESIVRSLSVPWAKHIAARPLVQEYQKYDNKTYGSLKWAIANALSVVADDSVFIEIKEFLFDEENGDSRQMLAVTVGNMKKPEAEDLLIELIKNDIVVGHAIIGLRKIKSKKALPYIKRFENHPITWVRNEAKKAISIIEKK